MSESEHDSGVVLALLKRLESQRLPRALALNDKVNQGECLDDYDIEFLKQVFADANQVKPLIDQHPEYEALATNLIQLYHDITEKALQNEKAK